MQWCVVLAVLGAIVGAACCLEHQHCEKDDRQCNINSSFTPRQRPGSYKKPSNQSASTDNVCHKYRSGSSTTTLAHISMPNVATCSKQTMDEDSLISSIERASKQTSECPWNKYLTSQSGVIISPRYTDMHYADSNRGIGYPDDQDCVWVIQAPRRQVISLSYHTNLLSPHCNNPEPAVTSLTIYDGTEADGRLLSQTCYMDTPSPVTSSGRSLHIRFRSSYTNNTEFPTRYNGFRIRYQHLGPDEEQGGPDVDPCAGSGPRLLTDSSGKLFSPGYNTVSRPQYPLDLDCKWRIVAEEGMIIEVRFSLLVIEESPDCRYDYLDLRDGEWRNAPRLAKLCNNNRDVIPDVVRTTGNSLYVHFWSDWYNDIEQWYDGWMFYYQAIPEGNTTKDEEYKRIYNYTLQGALSQTISIRPYLLSQQWFWYFTAANSTHDILFKLETVRLEDKEFCDADYLEFYDSHDLIPSNLLSYHCGFLDNRNILSSGPRAALVFYSNDYTTGAGFTISVRQKDANVEACKYNKAFWLNNALSASIHPQGFPDNIPQHSFCIWNIDIAEQVNKQATQMVFTDCPPAGDHTSVLRVHDHIMTPGMYADASGDPVTCNVPFTINSKQTSITYNASSSNPVGFRAKIIFVDPELTATSEPVRACTRADQPTIHYIGKQAMQLKSPGYPHGYANNLDCSWLFRLANDSSGPDFKVVPSMISIEAGTENGCVYDSLEIYNAECQSSDCELDQLMITASICGSHSNMEPILVKGPAMLIRFRTDQYKTMEGFVLSVESVNLTAPGQKARSPWFNPDCEMTTGVISQGYHIWNKSDVFNTTCTVYSVDGANENTTVFIAFFADRRDEVFSVGRTENGYCNNDYMWFGYRDVTTDTKHTVTTLCGMTYIDKLVFPPGRIPIIVLHNKRGRRRGPRMSVQVAEGDVEAVPVVCTETPMTHLGYWSHTFTVERCVCQRFTLTYENFVETVIVRIDIEGLHIEPDDKCRYDRLVVYTGGNVSRVYCGDIRTAHFTTDITSPQDNITIEYRSDASFWVSPQHQHVHNFTVTAVTMLGYNATMMLEASHCGMTETPLIVGGTITTPGRYPWAVALMRDGVFICGATIIGDQWVLTAAHCITDDTEPSRYHVLVHSHNVHIPDPGSQQYRVEEINSMVFFDDELPYSQNDIALLKTNTTMEAVTKICVAKEVPPPGEWVTVVGWGRTSFGGAPSSVLREASVQVIATRECTSEDWRYHLIDLGDDLLCAGMPDGERDSCQGDSGGPLMVQVGTQWQLVGVVSRGFECARVNAPGLYTRVSGYAQWITTQSQGEVDGMIFGVSDRIIDLWK